MEEDKTLIVNTSGLKLPTRDAGHSSSLKYAISVYHRQFEVL